MAIPTVARCAGLKKNRRQHSGRAAMRGPDMRLIALVNEFMARARAAGRPVLSFTCPCCSGALETLAPEVSGETWDSLSVCAHCGEMFMKLVTKAHVTCLVPEQEEAR